MSKKYVTKSFRQTQKLGENFAKEILKLVSDKAVILGLRGNLGGGKTTFLQGFAKGLSVKEKILSPTFVIQKKFKFATAKKSSQFDTFFHIDCYRLENEKDILAMGFKKITADPKNIITVEWPEKIKKILPEAIIFIDFKFIGKNEREIIFKI